MRAGYGKHGINFRVSQNRENGPGHSLLIRFSKTPLHTRVLAWEDAS